ncbi:vacuolar fusion protein CCZ1 homolog [Dendroctonus ponderosae]|uniref:vacuolar fusion protein CCZ1 homolog n=1 Tax=Dendroctonus ponderosae TaxID=77166 RepID=UPI002034C80E|nr:vacuolar fusion protein CCZ1 homolog [Dendroctonus ponderosae]
MGALNQDVDIQNFFIFNSQLCPKEGEELKKIVYYYPPSDNTEVQVENVGLVEGIIQFTQTFNPDSPVKSLHTGKQRQLFLQPERDFWIVLTIALPVVTKVKENTSFIEYLEEDVQDNVYESVLRQLYDMYRLFWGTFQHTLEQSDLGTLMTKIEKFYNAYLKTLRMAHMDILTVFKGIQYLPLDRHTFLKIQCFVNDVESNMEYIAHTTFLYNEHVVWSGIEPNDMQTIYQYLIDQLLPANVEAELQGGSMPRNLQSPFTALRRGRFITGPSNLKQAKTVGKVPKIYLFNEDGVLEYYLVVYRALSATVCFFVKGKTELTLDQFKALDEHINPRLSPIVNSIADYCSKQVVSPSNIQESSPKFIYFNKLNLACKSTVHLDNKHTGNVACSADSLRIMADMKNTSHFLGPSGENIVKTTNDYWVFSKTSNLREFYIVLQQKSASLISISEEVKRLCESELEGIFFHPM